MAKSKVKAVKGFSFLGGGGKGQLGNQSVKPQGSGVTQTKSGSQKRGHMVGKTGAGVSKAGQTGVR